MRISIKKAAVVVCLGMGLMLPLTACQTPSGQGGSSGESEAASTQKPAGKPEISADQFSYTLEEGLFGNTKAQGVTFTNNTAYKIIGIKMTFTPKADITDEQKASLNNIYKGAADNFDDGYYSYMDTILDKGQTSEARPVLLGISYITDPAYMDLVEPGDIQLRILGDDNLLYTAQINVETGKVLLSSDTFDTTQWFTSDTGAKLSKPETGVLVEIGEYSNIDSYSFTSAGIDSAAFSSYVEKLKEAGFSNVEDSSNTTFKAANEDGSYEVSVFYYEESQGLQVSLSKKV